MLKGGVGGGGARLAGGGIGAGGGRQGSRLISSLDNHTQASRQGRWLGHGPSGRLFCSAQSPLPSLWTTAWASSLSSATTRESSQAETSTGVACSPPSPPQLLLRPGAPHRLSVTPALSVCSQLELLRT